MEDCVDAGHGQFGLPEPEDMHHPHPDHNIHKPPIQRQGPGGVPPSIQRPMDQKFGRDEQQLFRGPEQRFSEDREQENVCVFCCSCCKLKNNNSK